MPNASQWNMVCVRYVRLGFALDMYNSCCLCQFPVVGYPTQTRFVVEYGLKGVHPQSDGSLAIVYIDASKWFVDLWVHLSFAIFDTFDKKRQEKLLEMAFDQVQTCLIFPFRWAHFSIKDSRKTQWVHPFSMNFNWFRSVCLYSSLKVHLR